MSDDLTRGTFGESDRSIEEIFGIDPETLIGKEITGVKVEGQGQRVRKLRLAFSDGLVVKLGYWASYADDSSLDAEIVREKFGESDG